MGVWDMYSTAFGALQALEEFVETYEGRLPKIRMVI
jgi:hypothetical protein